MLSGLIGQFSATYLHRESGFLRFFLLLHLFAFGSLLAFAAGSFDLLAAGWEVVGITSVLLIGFFELRPAPVENGLCVFGIYRACDIGLLVGIFAMHHWAGTASFDSGFPSSERRTGGRSFVFSCCCCGTGKAAQVPFSGWLPRAMEGPTPSSAIFYGAISIHAGRIPSASCPTAACQIRAGFRSGDSDWSAATAIHGTIVGRASADAKTSLAYATLTQVGIVFIEIGLGWRWLAVAHILGNATVRTMQYLRAPSMLHDYHQMHSAIGGDFSPTGKQIEALLPERVQVMALSLGVRPRPSRYDDLERWVIAPLLAALCLSFAAGSHPHALPDYNPPRPHRAGLRRPAKLRGATMSVPGWVLGTSFLTSAHCGSLACRGRRNKSSATSPRRRLHRGILSDRLQAQYWFGKLPKASLCTETLMLLFSCLTFGAIVLLPRRDSEAGTIGRNSRSPGFDALGLLDWKFARFAGRVDSVHRSILVGGVASSA